MTPTELADKLLEEIQKPFKDDERDKFDGPRMLDSSLELKEDFFSVMYLHSLKRGHIFGDDVPSEAEEVDAENEQETQDSPGSVNDDDDFKKAKPEGE